jgi:ankyrin repeat protein
MVKENDVAGIRLAILEGFEINGVYSDPNDGNVMTPLLKAIQKIRPEIVKLLLQNGADTELTGSTGNSALLMTLAWTVVPTTPERGSDVQEIFDMLMESGADVNFMDQFGITPLTQTVSAYDYQSSIKMTKRLLAAGVDVNPKFETNQAFEEKIGMPPLMWAINAVYVNWAEKHENRIELVTMLLEAGAEINYALSDGGTVLHQAAEIGDYELMRVLLDAGADKCVKNKSGKTPYDIAHENHKSSIEKLLVIR